MDVNCALSLLGLSFFRYFLDFPKSCLLGVESLVNMKQGPRSGIFSVYILKNVDYILLTYFTPLFLCTGLFSVVKQKPCGMPTFGFSSI